MSFATDSVQFRNRFRDLSMFRFFVIPPTQRVYTKIGQKGNSVILYVNDYDSNTGLNLSSMMRGKVS
jgi:hypothetical protein